MVKKKKNTKLVVPALERLKRQIEDIEWLLAESGFDLRAWEAVATCDDEDADGIVLGLSLAPRGPRTILLLHSTPNPTDGDRHFHIDGSHWYEEHAVGVLRDRLSGKNEEE